MDKAEIVNRLTQVFNAVFNNQPIVLRDDMTANDVDQWDSLSHMLLISEIESEFAFKFKLKDLNRMATVGDLINIIAGKLETARA